jgi:CRISPR-associated protein Cas5t
MFRLRVIAPFATFRPTAPFLTPSAAYGLILNVAGIESRFDDGRSLMTLMESDLPHCEIALGAVNLPKVHSVYQHLHNYPVGNEPVQDPECPGRKIRAKELGLRRAKGAKYNIQPVRREFLSGLDAYICLRANDTLEREVRDGLREGAQTTVEGRLRYGIPFLGDNCFMVDVLREEREPKTRAYWYRKLGPADTEPAIRRCRLTACIDRADMTRTIAYLYAPDQQPNRDPPGDDYWTLVAPPPAPTTKHGGPKRRRNS